MKKLAKILLILVIVIIIAAVAIPFLVPLDSYKGQIIAQVKEKTGRELAIDGHIKASIFPVLGVQIGKASLSNPKGYSDKNMVELDGLNVQVGLLALLHKQLQVKEFILSKPQINLEVNASGKPNWEFGETKAAPEEKTAKKEENSSDPTALLAGLMLGDIKISDGKINYVDSRTKKIIAVTELNLKASLPGLSQPFIADGSAVWNGEKVSLKTSVAKPGEVLDGKKSAFEFDLKSNPITATYAGEASQKGAKGKFDLNIGSLPKLAKWTGSAFDWKGSAPLAFSIHGELDASEAATALNNAEIALDAIKLKGNIKAKTDEKIPTIEATLASDSIDLNPYLTKAPAKISWIISDAVAAELSNQHIDLSGLNAANAKINLTLGNIIYEKVKIGKSVINASLNNGALKLNVPEMALYGGNAKATSTIDSGGSFTKQFNITNVNAGELLGDLSANNRFTGTMNASASLNGKLTSVQGAMKTLGGNGSIKFTDGSIKGIDLKNMVNNIKSAFTNVDNSQEKTVFSELSGTFTINQGIVTNNDLSLKSQLLTLAGKGTVNLPQQTLNYRLTPAFVSTVKKGDGSNTQGLEVPIIIEGPLDNPRFVPDLAGMVQNAIQNPNALRNTAKTLKEQFKGGKPDLNQVKDLLKGFGQ